MNPDLTTSIEILSKTPSIIKTLTENLSDDLIYKNEGGDTWCVYDVVGHLIRGEKTDWIPRMNIILSDKSDKSFETFDRFAQFQETNKSFPELLDEFSELRKKNLQILSSKNLTTSDFQKNGIHPEFGEVTLAQLISTWTVHDLNHLSQISRIIAKQYDQAVGPWKAYLRILQS